MSLQYCYPLKEKQTGDPISAALFFRNYMNDSLRTNVFVRFQPETIACACIYLAARALQVSTGCTEHCYWSGLKKIRGNTSTKPGLKSPLSFSLFDFQIPLPTRPHWFLLFGTTEEEIQEICLTTLKLYTRKKVSLTCWIFLLDAQCSLS